MTAARCIGRLAALVAGLAVACYAPAQTAARCIGRLAALVAGLAVACYAPAHPGPAHVHPCGADGRVTERTHTLPSGVVMTVRTTACRPVRHGRTTGVHVEVVR